MLNELERNDTINIKSVNSGEHSTIYKLDDKFCLKLLNCGRDVEWENEFEVLSKLQQKQYIPKLYAYSVNKFLLIEWIEGYNLFEYVKEFGIFPSNFIEQYFEIKIDLLESGFAEWDFKANEHLIWLKDSIDIVKKIDFGVCEVVTRDDVKKLLISPIKEEYEALKNKEPKAINDFKEELYKYGFSNIEVSKIL